MAYSDYEWPPLPVLDMTEAGTLLAEALQAAWDDLEAERLRVLASLHMGRKELVDAWLREFEAAIVTYRGRVEHQVERFLALHLGPRYEEAVLAVTGEQSMTWTQAHMLALTSLAIDTYDDFLRRSQEAGRTAEAFARAVRQAAREELPKIAAGARTATGVGGQLEEKLLTRYGISHVTYADGSMVQVRHYARMVARTKSAVAYNAGTLNAVHAAGGRYVEVFDGADCGWTSHDDIDKANGTIRLVKEAAAWPISHPMCVRGFGARMDIKNSEDAAKAKPSTTAGQRADQAENVDWHANVPAQPRTRASELRRVTRAAKRQQRLLGTNDPEQVGAIIDRLLKEHGLGPST